MHTLTQKPLDETIAKILSLLTEDEKTNLILTNLDDDDTHVTVDPEATSRDALANLLEFVNLPNGCTLKKYRVSHPSFLSDEANELLDNYSGLFNLSVIDEEGMFDLWMVVK